MMTSRAIGPPARAELIGRTTHFSDSLSTARTIWAAIPFGTRKDQQPRSGSGGRGGSPPADSPRQGLGARGATVEHDVHRARAEARRRSTTPAASSTPCPIPVRIGGRREFGSDEIDHTQGALHDAERLHVERAGELDRSPGRPRHVPDLVRRRGKEDRAVGPRSGHRSRRSRRRSRARWSSPARWRSTTARVDRAAGRPDAPTARRPATAWRGRGRRARSSG